jgi:hypothetical protein
VRCWKRIGWGSLRHSAGRRPPPTRSRHPRHHRREHGPGGCSRSRRCQHACGHTGLEERLGPCGAKSAARRTLCGRSAETRSACDPHGPFSRWAVPGASDARRGASVGHRHAGAGAWHRRLLALAGHPMARRWQLPVASMWLSRRPDQNAVPPQAWRCFCIVLDYLSRCIRAGNYLAEGAPNSAKEHLQLRNHYAINRKWYWRTEM